MKHPAPAAALAAASLAAVLAAAPPALAQVYGTYASAEILPVNGHQAGFFLNASDRTLAGLAQLRLSFYPGIDFGFQGGLARVSWKQGDRTTLRLGSDLRIAVAHAGEGFPFDIALDGGLGVESSDSYHVLTLMPGAVASRPISMGENGSIAPYVGLGLAFANVDAGATQQTFVTLPLRLGADLRIMPGMRLSAELQIPIGNAFNESVGVATGVNLPF